MQDSDPHAAGPPASGPDNLPVNPEALSPPVPEADGGTSFVALRDEVSALVEDARTYAEAEIAFQKTRAALAGKHGARALALLVLALVLLHIALIALAVGAVIALAPLVTIWGAIGIVVGVMILGVLLLVRAAISDGRLLSVMFGSGEAS